MADGQVVIQVKSNAKDAARDFDRLDKSLDNTEKELKQVDRAADKTATALGAVKAAAGPLIAAFAAVEVAKFGKELVNVASDAEETANKFSVVFSSIQSEAQAAADSLAESFGLAGDEAQKFLADTGDLLTGFGFTQESALDLSVQLNSLAVDLASFTNVEGGTQRATEALTSALFGETEAAKSLGIVITQDVVKAKVAALRASGRLKNETDNEARAIATLELAYEQSKNAIGDFARSQDSFANQTRIASANIRDLKVALGDELLPTATDIIEVFNDVADAITAAYAPTRQERLRQIAFDLNEASLELKDFTSTFNGSFLRSFDGIEASATPRFKELSDEIARLKEEQTSLQEVLTGSNQTSTDNESNPIVKQTNLLKDLQDQANAAKIELQNLFLSGQEDTEQFAGAKSKYEELTKQINDAKEATKGFQKQSEDSFNIATEAADAFSRNAARSLFEPWQEGETAADRFKNIAIESIKDILAEFIAAELKKQAVALVTAALTGGASLFGGAAAGAAGTTASAKGNAFSGGSLQAFANGGAFTNGIVSSPTTFPMTGGKTGLMGEAGPEAIMPLDRDQSGRLGVQVTQAPVNVSVINNAPVQVQSVVRPDNQLDIIIDQFNVAASNSRTSAGFTEAFSRNSLAGTYGV